MTHQNKLREGLFHAEPISLERQRRFREELDEITNPRLPRSHRLYYTVSLIGFAIGIPGAVCGFLFDAEHRWIWGLNLVALIPAAGWILYILRRGAEPLRTMQGLSKAAVGFSVLAAFVLIYVGIQNPSLVSVFWALLGLMLFLLTSSINLWNRVIAAEITTREHVLRLEYRIADLTSRLMPRGDES